MPNDDQLSSEDLTALMLVRAQLPADDPRGAKIDAFIKSQLQNFVPDATAQAQAFTRSQIKPLILGTGTIDPTGGGLAAAQAGQNPAFNEQMRQSGNIIGATAGGVLGGVGAAGLATKGLPGAIGALGKASAIGAGVGAGQLASEPGNPKGALGTAASTTVLGVALSPVAKFISDLAGKAKAGPLFEAVSKAAGENAVDTTGPLAAAQQAKELQNAGFSMPRVLNRFIARMNSGEPLTFDEARNFEQAAGGRLSAEEAMRIKPQMRRQLAIFADEMRKSTMQAAGQSGAADTFQGALQMHRAGAQAQEKVEFTKEVMLELLKQAAKGAALAGGGTAAYQGIKAITKATP